MMSNLLMICGAVVLTASLVLMFAPRRESAPVAFAGLLLLQLSGHIVVSTTQLVFWGVAALIVLGLNVLLPASVAGSSRGVAYMAGGALAGTLVGMLTGSAGLIIGSVAGALCGAVAYSRTPGGRDLGFPSQKFFNYAAAKGFPAVITSCIIGIAIALFASQWTIINNIQ